MPDLVHNRDLADIELESEETVDMFLRVKHIGKFAEGYSEPLKIQVKDPKPAAPIITPDRTDVTPGYGINVSGGTFNSLWPNDEHLATDWKVTTDSEGRDVASITGRPVDLTSAIIDDFIDRPTGNYYISARYQGKCGWSKWATPTSIHWTNWEIPDEYWENQIAVFDQVKAASEAAKTKNLAKWFSGQWDSPQRFVTLRMEQIQSYDSPLSMSPFVMNVSNRGANVDAIASGFQAYGDSYGDTFQTPINWFTPVLDNNKKGCILATEFVPNRQFFDLTKTNNKLVICIKDSYSNTGEYYLAFEGEYWIGKGQVYGCKKVRAVTTRPDVTVPLMTI